MKLLAIVPSYPHAGHCFSGIFNERSVGALATICEGVEVLAPRPYVLPCLAARVPRWKIYRRIPSYEARNGIPVYRPPVLHLPGWGGALGAYLAFFSCRRVAQIMHDRVGFDAIVSFDLFAAGALAWRIGRSLGVPACGWATGGDLNLAAAPSARRALVRTLKHLDVAFYQSHELLDKAAELLGCSSARMPPGHFVLPRGIAEPPELAKKQVRARLRAQWAIKPNQLIVLYVGRLLKQKGILELLQAARITASRKPGLVYMLLGSQPAFDETAMVLRWLEENPFLNPRVRILPACPPADVSEALCAADLFVFPSHREGMPNSLLEAMVMEVPAVAFSIPPVLEIEAGRNGIALAPPFDSIALAQEILRLAAAPKERAEIAKRGKAEVMRRFMARKNMRLAVKWITGAIEERSFSKSHLRAYEGV